ncbi:MAG: sensor histidine kinase, partial [Pseudomonadota bacterium]
GKFAPQDAVIGADLHRQGARFRLRIWNSGSAFPVTWDGSDFERLKRGRDHGEIRGFGLGLALVNMIARWHGFTLTAQNSVLDSSLGSVAVVTLEGPCVGSD